LSGRSKYPFVSDDFVLPEVLENKDYDAVMSSAEHLRSVWPDSGWPGGLTLEEDLIDLGWHQKEFVIRLSFAYTLVCSTR